MTGRVLRSTGSHYQVMDTDDNIHDARLRGRLKLKGSRLTNPVAVGDEVSCSKDEDGYVWIESIFPRKNHIIRRSTNLSKDAHIIAANIDQLLLVSTIRSPQTSMGFVNRLLVTAEAYHIPSILIINKIDLLNQEDEMLLEEWKATYQGAGYQVLTICAETVNLSVLEGLMKDKVTLLSGHSGVGKSTLVNRIQPDLELRTAEVSKAYDKGKHTTTFATMHPLEIGGFIVDTPGIKGFGIVDIPREELSHYFPEMRELLHDCKFNDCRHIDEPGCAVKAALEKGLIAESRYLSYLSMYEGDDGSFRKDIYA